MGKTGSGKTHFPLLVFCLEPIKGNRKNLFSFSFFLLHFLFTISFFHLQDATINFVIM